MLFLQLFNYYSAVPRVVLGIPAHAPGLGLYQKYWRTHRQTDRQKLWLYLTAF